MHVRVRQTACRPCKGGYKGQWTHQNNEPQPVARHYLRSIPPSTLDKLVKIQIKIYLNQVRMVWMKQNQLEIVNKKFLLA